MVPKAGNPSLLHDTLVCPTHAGGTARHRGGAQDTGGAKPSANKGEEEKDE